MSSVALANPQVTVNNIPIAVVPNSVKFTEGFGEQNMRAASTGGAGVEQVFSQNVESNFSMVSFQIYPTPDNIGLARTWKQNVNQNVVAVTGTVTVGGSSSSIQRSFTNAAILNDYEVDLGADSTIELEFKSDAAV